MQREVQTDMKKTIVLVVIAVLLISSFPTIVFAAPPDNPAPASGFSSEQILVKFKPGTSLPEAAQIHRQLGGQVNIGLELDQDWLLGEARDRR